MALNQVYAYSQNSTREWLVPAGTVAGSPVFSLGASGKPGVALTTRNDSSAYKTFTHADGTTATVPTAAVGQTLNSATIATDGTFSFPVTGASGSTPKGTAVYAVVSGGAITSLTLTVGSNVKYGAVDTFPGKATAQATAVKIGAGE